MILGTFAYGPLDRLLGTRKWVIFTGNLVGAGALAALWLLPVGSPWMAMALFAMVGFFAAAYPMIMAHGRSFFPAHLVGRGVTLMNLFSIGGVGVFQVATGQLHRAVSAKGGAPQAPYEALFVLFLAAMAVGLALYLFSRDRVD